MGNCITVREKNINSLLTVNFEELPKCFCQNKDIEARVVDIYDGDTVTVIFFWGDEPIKIKIRLIGIDTPEIRKFKHSHDLEKIAAMVCRGYLNNLILGKIVKLRVKGWDKYGGRLLGSIEHEGKDISQLMIEEGLARKYEGKTKLIWTESELIKIIKK